MPQCTALATVSLVLAAALVSAGCRGTGNASEVKGGAGEPVAPSAPAAGGDEAEPIVGSGATDCLFGLTLDDLRSSPDFKATKKGQEQRAARLSGDDGKPKLFAITEYKHFASGESFTVFNTFRDQDDGGSTIGWAERAGKDEVVAEIRDGAFDACKVKGAAVASEGGGSSCLFGFDLTELETSPTFTSAKGKDVTRASRIPGETKKKKAFHVRTLTHKPSGRAYTVFVAHDAKEHDSEATGWIENAKSGELVAQVGESEIYKCTVTAAGEQKGALAEEGGSCRFGADLHDLELSEDFDVPQTGEEISMKSRVGEDARLKAFLKRGFKHKQSGQGFTVFNTFKDQDDGGNTIGWIEDKGGKLVAEIGDSEIYNCKF